MSVWYIPLWVKADISHCNRYVRFTPKSGHWRCTSSCPLWANSGHWLAYSITSSAATRSPGGMLMPSAFAVLRLRIVSNLVGA